MTTDLDHKEFDRLASLYAVGALNASERKLFETHLELCHTCVGEVLLLLPVVHALTRVVPQHDAPAQLRGRVCKADTDSSTIPSARTVSPMRAWPVKVGVKQQISSIS